MRRMFPGAEPHLSLAKPMSPRHFYNLVYSHELGKGVGKDTTKAFQPYRQAEDSAMAMKWGDAYSMESGRAEMNH